MTRVNIQGVPVDSIPPGELMSAIERLHKRGNATVSYANVHVINQAQDTPELLQFLHEASLVYCDGNGVRLGARITGQNLPPRNTGADWIWDLAAEAEGKWRIFWIGGKPGVAEEAARTLTEAFPKLAIQTDHGFHERSGPADSACIDRINAFEPDIVLVGMGTPEQERWVQQRRTVLNAPLVWCIGATADVVAGRVSRGPDWLVARAEWVARLSQDPIRLWRRYLLGNPAFVLRALKQRFND